MTTRRAAASNEKALDAFMTTKLPVSYTHLDVYKRQL